MTPALASAGLSAGGMLAGYLAWLGLTHAVSADPAATEAMRMGAACAALLPTAALLAAMVATQMIGRATSAAIDPTAGDDNRFLQVNQRVLTNTVEQLAILVPALLALAAVTSPAAMPRVVALALVFALARLVFWIGYLCHPVLRAAGMAPSMAVSLATLGAAAVAWLR